MERQRAATETCRVLVADDDTATLLLFRAALSGQVVGGRCGGPETSGNGGASLRPAVIELVECRQAEEAVVVAAAAVDEGRPFAIAILDVVMPPGAGGVWAAEQIRAIDPGIQIILVTARTTLDPREVAGRIPPPDKLLYVHKPIDPLELLSLATAFCSKWRIELAVDAYRSELEQRVVERTGELSQLNQELQRDIAERRRVEEALRKSEASLVRAQRMANLGSWEVNLLTGDLTCSDETLRILGRSYADPPRSIGNLLESVHPDDRPLLEQWLTGGIRNEPSFSMEHRLLRADHTERIVHQLVVVAYDTERGQPTELRGTMQDITELKRSEEQLIHLALHDALTGLPNRRLFNDRLQIAIAHARRRQRRLAVLFLDLDRFKAINDNLGHQQGDLLLQAVAERLLAALREGDTVARVGGDEFLVLLVDVGDPTAAVQVAERLVTELAAPFQLAEHELEVTASIGISLFPDDAEDPDGLVTNADIAMCRAKDRGGDPGP